MKKISNYINGQLEPSSSLKYIDVFNPSTGKIYAKCPDSTKIDLDKAIKSAKKSEEKYSSNKKTLPLEGIPVAIKDEEDITGQPNTNGSLILKNHIASKTMVDVERIIESGAITHCRTTTPEFSCTSFTHSKL